LAAHIKEGVLGPVTRRRRPDDHSRRITALAVHAVGNARRAAERPQVGQGVTQLRFRPSESEEHEQRRETDDAFCFHGG